MTKKLNKFDFLAINKRMNGNFNGGSNQFTGPTKKKKEELEKENAEMKKQLTKAKEIIKDYLTIVKGSHTTMCGVPEENRTIYVLKLNEKAEEFLNSEVEE